MVRVNPSTGRRVQPGDTTSDQDERREPEDSIAEQDSTSESDPMTDLGSTNSPDTGGRGDVADDDTADWSDVGSGSDSSDSGGSTDSGSSGSSGSPGGSGSSGGIDGAPTFGAPDEVGDMPGDEDDQPSDPSGGGTDSGTGSGGGSGSGSGGGDSSTGSGSGSNPVDDAPTFGAPDEVGDMPGDEDDQPSDPPAGDGRPDDGSGDDSPLPDGPPQGPRGPQGDENVGTDSSDGPEIGDDVVPGANENTQSESDQEISGPGDPLGDADVEIDRGDDSSDVAEEYAAETGLQPGEDFTVTREDGSFVTEYTDSYFQREYAEEYDDAYAETDIGADDISLEETTNAEGESVVQPSLTEEAREQTVVNQVDAQYPRFYLTEDDVNVSETTNEEGETTLQPSLTDEAAEMITEREVSDAAGVSVTGIELTDEGNIEPQTNESARELAEYQVRQQNPSADDVSVTEVADGVFRATVTSTEDGVQPSGQLTSTVVSPEGEQTLADLEAGGAEAEAQRRAEQTQNAFERGARGDTREEAAARELSDRYGFEVRESDVDVVREDGELQVRVDQGVAEAGALAQEAERNALAGLDITRTAGGDFDVNIEGGFQSGQTAQEVEAELESAGGQQMVSITPVTDGTADVGVGQSPVSGGETPSPGESLVSTSQDLTRSITQNIVRPGAAAVGNAIDVGMARERGEFPTATDEEVEETTAGQATSQVVLGAGEATTAATVGAPAIADSVFETAEGGARYTASEVSEGDVVDPVVAGGEFAANVAREEAEFAADQPARYAGQLAGGALVGGVAGRAAGRAAPDSVTGGRIGAATRAAVDPVRTTVRAGRRSLSAFRRDTRGRGSLTLGDSPDVDGDTSSGLVEEMSDYLDNFERAERIRAANRRAEEWFLERQREPTQEPPEPTTVDTRPGGDYTASGGPGGDYTASTGVDTLRSGPTEAQMQAWGRSQSQTGSPSMSPRERQLAAQQEAAASESLQATSAIGASEAGAASGAVAAEPIGLLDAAQARQVQADDQTFGATAQAPATSSETVAQQNVGLLEPVGSMSEGRLDPAVDRTVAPTDDVSVDAGAGTVSFLGTETTTATVTDTVADESPIQTIGPGPSPSPTPTPAPSPSPAPSPMPSPAPAPTPDPTVTPTPTPTLRPDPTPNPDGDDDDLETFGLLDDTGFEESRRQFEEELTNPLTGPREESGQSDSRDDDGLFGGFL